MDALIREVVESKDPRLANDMDMLEKAFDVEFLLQYSIGAVTMVLTSPPNCQTMLLESSCGLPSYFAQYLVGRKAAVKDIVLDCARMFTRDAYHTFNETEASLRMKLELRGKA